MAGRSQPQRLLRPLGVVVVSIDSRLPYGRSREVDDKRLSVATDNQEEATMADCLLYQPNPFPLQDWGWVGAVPQP